MSRPCKNAQEESEPQARGGACSYSGDKGTGMSTNGCQSSHLTEVMKIIGYVPVMSQTLELEDESEVEPVICCSVRCLTWISENVSSHAQDQMM